MSKQAMHFFAAQDFREKMRAKGHPYEYFDGLLKELAGILISGAYTE